MNIQIFSAEEAAKELKQHSKRWHVISLRDCKYRMDNHPLNGLEKHAKDILIKYMDDVPYKRYDDWGYHSPKKEDVEEIIQWVKEVNPKNLMVHCWAGISRSSATAYIVGCKFLGPERAIHLLDRNKHRPNGMIIDHGLEIVKDPKARELFSRFLKL